MINSSFGSGNLIKLAIKKYGKQNFKNEILEECNSPEELDNRERYYINKYKSNDISIGYNISNGGQKRFFTGLKHSDESKRKMSEAAKHIKHLPTTNNRKWVNKDGKNKMIDTELISEYLSNGWELGRYNFHIHNY